MAKRKHQSTYRKATDALEQEGRKQCFIIYGASAIALWRYYGKRKQAITRVFDITSEVWQDCARTNQHSMIEMCEKETGIEVQNGEGKSWRDLPYLNASLNQSRMSEAQWIYMRHQQMKWIAPQVMACIMISLHRKYHFGFERCGRFYQQVDAIRAEYDNDPDRIREECRKLTGIDVADTTTRKREEKKVV